MSTGLSDALSRLADGDHAEAGQRPHGTVAPSGATRRRADEPLPDGLAEPQYEQADTQPRVVPAPARSRPRPPARRDANHGLKAAAVPVLITVGVLLLVPGVWSLLILTGTWESPREDARNMAIAMLATWPIALSMFAGAGFFWWQVRGSSRD